MQPPAFVEVVSRGAANRIVLAGPGHFRQEFSDYKAVRCVLYVFAVGPPSEIVRSLEILIGTLKQRDICLEKLNESGLSTRASSAPAALVDKTKRKNNVTIIMG